VIADAVYFAIAGFDFYHATARALISRGLKAGLTLYGWMRQRIDAAAKRRRIDQEDLKNAGELGRSRALLKCITTPI
jgi:hypothetical protein